MVSLEKTKAAEAVPVSSATSLVPGTGKEAEGLAYYSESYGWIPCRVAQYLGKCFLYPVGSGIGDLIAQGAKWDSVLTSVLGALITEERPFICEVGSNIGASLLIILCTKPGADVISFEPSQRFRVFLEYNLQSAGFSQVKVRPCIVSRNAGQGFIHTDGTSGSVEPLGHLNWHQPADVTTLDIELGMLPRVDFIKVDTDGHDFEVLRGAGAVIRRHAPILYFEFFPGGIELSGSDPIDGLKWLASMGYSRYVVLNPTGYFVGMTSEPAQVVQWGRDYTYCDILACAENSLQEQRLKELSLIRAHSQSGIPEAIICAEATANDSD